MTMIGAGNEYQATPESKPRYDWRRLAVSGLPIVVLVVVAFGYGYSQSMRQPADAVALVHTPVTPDPEVQRIENGLSGTIVNARVQSHLERHACLSQLQFTTVELLAADGTRFEAMLPLQVTNLESAKRLFPAGKVESFRLSKVENIKASDGSELYAITDAAMLKK